MAVFAVVEIAVGGVGWESFVGVAVLGAVMGVLFFSPPEVVWEGGGYSGVWVIGRG